MMATDTVPAAVPMPPEPPPGTPAATNSDHPAKGFLASMVAAVEPARPTNFDIVPTTDAAQADTGDGVLDRSTPGLSSASFRDAQDAGSKDPSGEKRKAQGSIWKAWWLAGAQRWAKGGGTANKRLDVQKAKAQATQVKEARTTTVTNSGGLPVRNSVGAGGGSKGNGSKSGPNSRGKGPVNSAGTPSGGAGRGGSGGGRGTGGGSGSHGAHGGGAGKQNGHGKGSDVKGPIAKGPIAKGPAAKGPAAKGPAAKGPAAKGPASNGSGKDGKAGGTSGAGGPGSSGKNSGAGAGKTSGGHDSKQPKSSADKGSGKTPGTGSGWSGKQGSAGKSGTAGKDGKAGGTGGSGSPTGRGSVNTPGQDHGKHSPGKGKKTDKQPDTRTPLEKSREIGHKDGSAVRNVIDHVKAYKDGARDGYHDKRDENAKDHTRLDKAHDKHKPKTATTNDDKTKASGSQPVIVTEKEDDGVTTDVKPLTVKTIDANTLTLGIDATRTTYGRRELRNFKQYERKLEAKETDLQKISEACKQLEKEAEKEAEDCRHLLEQAKSVEGGESLSGKLTQLADTAKNQAAEAGELSTQAKRAAEMCKVVLTNIQTRYTPLYKAVVDSPETKPAELRFYNDKGSHAPAA